MNPDISYLVNLKPEEIIKWFNSKGYKISWNWRDTWQEAHAKSFTVAKAMKLDILRDIHKEVNKIFEEGTTYQEFRKNLEPLLRRKGWWGKVKAKDVPGFSPSIDIDPDKVVQLGSPHRLKTIYETNASVGYNSGRFKSQFENASLAPYWQYIQIERETRRDEHLKLHKKVFRYDDPIWDTAYPPNGWFCGCRVRDLTDAELKAQGLTVSKGTDFSDFKPAEGWAYNPGKAAFFPDLNKYETNIAEKFVEGGLDTPDFNLFYDGKIKGNFPVAVINSIYQKLIAAKTNNVLLSDESLLKNKQEHPDLSKANYFSIPQIIAGAKLIIKKGNQNLLFVNQSGKYYLAVVKSTKNGKELFLTSFRRTKLSDIKTLKNSGEVILDEL